MEELLVPAELGPRLLDLSGHIKVLDWVGQSCDLNPIKNLWRGLNGIIGRMPACSNLEELTRQIKKAWAELSRNKEFLSNLTDLMPARIAAVLVIYQDMVEGYNQ